jgi:phage terminase large subunit-like protein
VKPDPIDWTAGQSLADLQAGLKVLTQSLAVEEAEIRARRTNRILEQFPDTGPFRRELYPKHIEFFGAGATETERCFMAGNRVGKTRAGACEMTYHLTGAYPDWWVGRRFSKPVDAWACGDKIQTVRDIVQTELLGRVAPDKDSKPEDPIGIGTGMIPLSAIRKTRPRAGGVADAIELAYIRHLSGGTSTLGFKSYDQGRKSFQGTGKHVIWVDEECPYDVYIECLARLMTTKGLAFLTFTPLLGLSEVVLRFLPGGRLD